MGKLALHGILTRKDLIAELGVTNDTLKEWEEQHDFPGRTVGRTTLYDVDDIKNWIKEKSK